MSFCPYCGQKNEPSKLSCARCGELLPATNREPQITPIPRAVGHTASFDDVAANGWGIPSADRQRAAHPTGGLSLLEPDGARNPALQHPRAATPNPREQERRVPMSNATHFLDARHVDAEIKREKQRTEHRLQGHAKLVVEQGLILGEQFLLVDQNIVVGRVDNDSGYCPDIDLSAQDPSYVHRRHAKLQFNPTGERLTVTDMGGRNGAFINNQQLAKNATAPLKLGDKLRIGRVVMRLVLAPEVDLHERE